MIPISLRPGVSTTPRYSHVDCLVVASRAVLGDLREPFERDLRERLSGLSAEDRFADEIEFTIISARAIA